jgi:propanediol utilization protein
MILTGPLGIEEQIELSKTHLYVSTLASAVHTAGDIHCISPDVVVRFLRTNYTSYHRTTVKT